MPTITDEEALGLHDTAVEIEQECDRITADILDIKRSIREKEDKHGISSMKDQITEKRNELKRQTLEARKYRRWAKLRQTDPDQAPLPMEG